ncbi:hypothetical protein [Clostridium saccharobutylicum]|uniref:Tail fiber protein n=1 Tax=Clostridium saccharobutylicum DSM 13864 TaxID=1345695 RepID=U5MR34_CLOSA|nr:hypothetical protein [Clostridium saccharobutylicum]AGX43269.1 hypothetical protein CLSA_c22940 [Clostridium saccharobutylicum DSM 13864]AQR90569.1 hypothetical protein CLOSC_22900 [Clostridium saccharobutylicum]AQS00473.1 hypothetical protein CSACC_22970 [Clostridium saccharobutylicum]AQS10123.1 hypothetical protein CLOBY_22660 [Clostridium saccharobutylicum]AQS14456.1 hypothetical protein CLOSACC_22970 [Clostridium saccharobutylicum]
MQKSANYGLKLFEGTDNVKRQDFVDNFQTIDTQLKKISDNLGNSAQKDSTMQKGLNAEMVGGKHAGDFTSAYDSFNQDSTDLNSYNSNKTWTARAGSNNPNTPSPISNYSTVLNVGSDNNSNFQIAGAYDGSNKLGYRCRHDTDGAYGTWKRILNEDDYNTLNNLANSAFQSASNGKNSIANAITGKGGSANGGMTFDQLASAITSIPGVKYSSGTTTEYASSGGSIRFILPNQSFTVLAWFATCGVYWRCGSIRDYNLTTGAWFEVADGSSTHGTYGATYRTYGDVYYAGNSGSETKTVTWYAIGY